MLVQLCLGLVSTETIYHIGRCIEFLVLEYHHVASYITGGARPKVAQSFVNNSPINNSDLTQGV